MLLSITFKNYDYQRLITIYYNNNSNSKITGVTDVLIGSADLSLYTCETVK